MLKTAWHVMFLCILGQLMPLHTTAYKPPLWLRNGHIHTIYAALFRYPPPVPWQRQRLDLPDGDFLDLDWFRGDNKRVVVLGHGLEGSSNSTYILAAAHLFYANGFDVLAWNHRSCSGEMNRLPRFYHHGVADDAAQVLHQTKAYETVFYVGYSLGGNVLLKYLGDDVLMKPANLKAAVAVSAPIDLPSCVAEIHKPQNRIYHNRFLKTLVKKVADKSRQMPDKLSAKPLKQIKTLTDFDTYYTAPLHHFASATAYYTKASSKPFLPHITIPTLLLQAQDDPMLAAPCFPFNEAKENNNLHLLATRYGGHVAFKQSGSKWHWMENSALEFILNHEFTHKQNEI